MKKRLILGLPTVYGIGPLLKENLQYMGFDVIDVSFNYAGFDYKNGYQRMVNFFHKTFLRDKSYKDKLRFAAHEAFIKERLNTMVGPAEYALIIRPDTFSNEVLQLIKSKSKTTIAYQWDGMGRFPWVEKLIPLFDRFFVFDPRDVYNQGNGCKYLGNFYFTLPRLFETPFKQKGGAYFVGGFTRERLDLLNALQPELAAAGIAADFNLRSKKMRNITIDRPGIRLTTISSSYEQNLEKVREATLLIDITAPCHEGLTLRFYEALCYQKKLITNNAAVKGYDFYHRDNIFIYGEDDLKELPDFLGRPYRDQAPALVYKYGFENWVRFALDLPPYTKIESPELPSADHSMDNLDTPANLPAGMMINLQG